MNRNTRLVLIFLIGLLVGCLMARLSKGAYINYPEAPSDSAWTAHEARVQAVGEQNALSEAIPVEAGQTLFVETMTPVFRLDGYIISYEPDQFIPEYDTAVLDDGENEYVMELYDGFLDGQIAVSYGSVTIHGQVIFAEIVLGDGATYASFHWGGTTLGGATATFSRAQAPRRPGSKEYLGGVNAPEVLKYRKKIIAADSHGGRLRFTVADTTGLHVDDMILITENTSYPLESAVYALTPQTITLQQAYSVANSDGHLNAVVLVMDHDNLARYTIQYSLNLDTWDTVPPAQWYTNSSGNEVLAAARGITKVRDPLSLKGAALAAFAAEPRMNFRIRTLAASVN